jgi:glucose-1-phosphate thymidylyltransferase
MKGLLLAGGRGTRLRPITHTSSKQLVPVANRPILFYGVDAMVDAGITDIVVIVGDTEAEIRAALETWSPHDVRFTFVRQSAPLGLAHAVLTARPALEEEPFVMYLGDNLVAGGIGAFVEEFRRDSPDALVMLARVPHPERFGVAALDEQGKLVGLVEKPLHPPSDLALVGVYMFSPAVHGAIEGLVPSQRGELEITDAIQSLIERGGRVESHIIDGWWKDTGHVDDLLEANRMMLEALAPRVEGSVDRSSEVSGKVVVEKGARIINFSVVRGPAIIGADSLIDHAYIGPYTSIHNDCLVRNSEVEHSVIMRGCRIEDAEVKIESSLLGRDVRVHRSRRRPVAVRLRVGDHSEVDLG